MSAADQATVLVVDDHAPSRAIVEAHLSAAGYHVVLAQSGEEALGLVRTTPVDLILLDVLMPGLDGFATCRRLRELPEAATTPVLFLTALGDLETQKQALGAGADDFLGKPVQRVELLLRVSGLLRLRRLQLEADAATELIRSQHRALAHAAEQRRQMSTMLVHDIMSPLAAIAANAQSLERRADLPADARECLGDVVASSERAQRMAANILDVDRGMGTTLVVRATSVALPELLLASARALKARVQDSGHSLITSVAEGAEHVSADPDLLRRVVDNLLENALKYAPARSQVRVEAAPAGSADVILRVRDEGPGVPPTFRQRIFDPYIRLEPDADALARPGRGLGLAMCQLAVRAHGGRIWVEDNQPRGAAFCVQLPREQRG